MIRLPNGFQAVIIENRNAPVIASVVMVGVGSTSETHSTSGISHMLEHLLFNGTKKRSQKELYQEQDFYGIYNNAHTSQEYTNYMVLSHKDHFDRALDIQSDMLFNSTIPPEKFEKEKGIILNEMAMSMMRDEYLAEELFNRKLFAGTPFNLPVLGLSETIQEMKRKTVLDFYQKYYRPNNMTAIIMGDFSREEMKQKVEQYFGSAEPGLLPTPVSPPEFLQLPAEPILSPKKINKLILRLGASAPAAGDADFFPYYLLVELISVDFKDRLNQRFHKEGGKETMSASLGMDFKKGFSSLRINLSLSTGSDPAKAMAAVEAELKSLSKRKFTMAQLRRILPSMKMEEVSLRERVHYFGMMAAGKMSAGGWSFTRNFVDGLEKVTLPEVERVAVKYFSNPSLFATALVPGGEVRKVSPEEKKEYYPGGKDSSLTSEDSLKLVKAWKASGKGRGLEAKRRGGQSAEPSGGRDIKETVQRRVLKNGLTVLAKRLATDGIFAVHLLVKNRSPMEPRGKEGMAELLHNLLDYGTKSRTKEQLRDHLMALGAKLKTADNPHIPFDNYYQSREYSYIRFETLDEYYQEGLSLLSDLVRSPLLLAEDVEREKKQLINLAKDKEGSAKSLSSNLLWASLLKGKGVDAPIHGTPESLASINVEDLVRFHQDYFSPKNLILSVVSGLDTEIVMKVVEETFGKMKEESTKTLQQASPPAEKPKGSVKGKTIRKKLGKSQSYLRLGKEVPVESEEEAAVKILGVLLSDRIAFQLREKEGLSYSLWAGFWKVEGKTFLSAAMGTTPDKIEAARVGLLREINNFSKSEIKPEDVERARHRSGSTKLMRSLTRIGQAYFLGLAEFQGKDQETLSREAKRLKEVTPAQVRSAARKYLNTDGAVVVIVE